MILNILKDFFKGLFYLLFFGGNLCLGCAATFAFPGLNERDTLIAYIITIFIFLLEYAIIKNTKYKTILP